MDRLRRLFGGDQQKLDSSDSAQHTIGDRLRRLDDLRNANLSPAQRNAVFEKMRDAFSNTITISPNEMQELAAQLKMSAGDLANAGFKDTDRLLPHVVYDFYTDGSGKMFTIAQQTIMYVSVQSNQLCFVDFRNPLSEKKLKPSEVAKRDPNFLKNIAFIGQII